MSGLASCPANPFVFHDLSTAADTQLAARTCGAETPRTARMRIELGSCGLDRDEACRLARGAVVPLTEALHEPLAVYADDRLFARGELVLLEGKFCVRVSELVVSSGCSDA